MFAFIISRSPALEDVPAQLLQRPEALRLVSLLEFKPRKPWMSEKCSKDEGFDIWFIYG